MRGESPAPDDQRCPPQILDGCPLSFLLSTATPPTLSPPASISPHAQVPVGGGDAFAPVAGGPGQFRSVQSAEEAGDLILGPAELEWNEQLGAGQPDNTDPLPENAAAPDATRTTSDSLYVPAALNCHLREYQRDGVRFLYTLWASGKGGVLADDMGLGKTIQTVAFLAAVLRSPKANPDPPQALVVCPMSVLENWEIELSRWGRMLPGGEFSVERVHGQSRDDAWRWLPKEALEPWPRTGEGLTDLTRAWAEVEATLVRTAPVGAVHSALWRRSELLDDDRTPLDETEAAGREAMRAEIERHRGAGTRAVEVDEDAGGFGGWGDGVEYY